MSVPFLLFVIAVVRVALFCELCKINSRFTSMFLLLNIRWCNFKNARTSSGYCGICGDVGRNFGARCGHDSVGRIKCEQRVFQCGKHDAMNLELPVSTALSYSEEPSGEYSWFAQLGPRSRTSRTVTDA